MVTHFMFFAVFNFIAHRHYQAYKLQSFTFLSAQCVSSIGQIIKSVCVSVSESVSHSVNFGTPSISRERLKLESSNLAQIGHWGS